MEAIKSDEPVYERNATPQPGTLNNSSNLPADQLSGILSRLRNLEELFAKSSKRSDDAIEPASTKLRPEDEDRVLAKGTELQDISKQISMTSEIGVPKAPQCPPEAITEGGRSLQRDPRYKYTQVNNFGMRKREEPRERPTLSLPSSETSEVFEYEIRFIKDGKDAEEKRQIILRNLGLKKLIWDVVYGWIQHCGSDKDWDNDKPLILRPLIMFHHWEQLQACAKLSDNPDENEKELKGSLQHLLDDVEVIESEKYKEFKALRDTRMTLFDSMHYLYTPGTYVVAQPFPGLPQVFQIDSYSSGKEFTLTVWAYDWDGVKLVRKSYMFVVEKWGGAEKRINDLPIYPVNFFVDEDAADGAPTTGLPALRRKMSSRAELFRRYCKCKKGGQLFKYSGSALTLSSPTESPPTESPFTFHNLLLPYRADMRDLRTMSWKHVDEEVIIDASSFTRHGSEIAYLGEKTSLKSTMPLSCKICDTDSRRIWLDNFLTADWRSNAVNEREMFDDQSDHFMLLPSRVLGFLLGRKEWAQFLVDDVRDVEQRDTNELKEQIAFPEGMDFNKLQDLVQNHSRGLRTRDQSFLRDPISGKGEGLVLLFHGPTGVGKTLTAEALAMIAGVPLYKAGISEIGTKPQDAERGLKHLFELAQAWNAILLIDEADVFLDSRGTLGEASLEKNAMVAVLLREVEYFSGILIMTTNRVMTFDVAMLSRIHWPINFGNLSKKQEDDIWKIWHNNWKHENEEVVERSHGGLAKRDVEREIEHYEAWREARDNPKPELNGREIRNIFLGARTMAHGGFVKWSYIKVCYSNIIRFRGEINEHKLRSEAALNVKY